MGPLDRIINAATEAREILLGGRIEKVWNLDDYTYFIKIRGKSKDLSLVVSILKRSKRFHLVFDPVQKNYMYTTSKADTLNKFIRGGRINDLLL